MTHSTASATFASSNTMMADLPPSSIEVGRRLAAAAMFTRRPVATLPVKATFAMAGCPLHSSLSDLIVLKCQPRFSTLPCHSLHPFGLGISRCESQEMEQMRRE